MICGRSARNECEYQFEKPGGRKGTLKNEASYPGWAGPQDYVVSGVCMGLLWRVNSRSLSRCGLSACLLAGWLARGEKIESRRYCVMINRDPGQHNARANLNNLYFGPTTHGLIVVRLSLTYRSKRAGHLLGG